MQITWKWNEKNKYSGGKQRKMPFITKEFKTWNTADYVASQDIGLLSYDDINSTDGLFP